VSLDRQAGCDKPAWPAPMTRVSTRSEVMFTMVVSLVAGGDATSTSNARDPEPAPHRVKHVTARRSGHG
jgi:hypothetical protein